MKKRFLVVGWAVSVVAAGLAGRWLADAELLSSEPVAVSGTDAANPWDELLGCARSVCFIGDSITAGSENGGVPWYVPLMRRYPHVRVSNFSEGGGTTCLLLRSYGLSGADVFVVALGTNDVRYRDPNRGAMTPEEYTGRMQDFVAGAREQSPSARFVFLAPWRSIPEDPVPPVSREEKDRLLGAFTGALRDFCRREGHLFIDPNPALLVPVNDASLRQAFLIDHIHPNGTKGVYFYSSAVYQSAGRDTGTAAASGAD